VDSIEERLTLGDVALGYEDIAQGQLGIGDHLVVTPPSGSFGALSVKVKGALEVPELAIELPEAVEEAKATDLGTHLFGKQ
jgi:hypothetical protein